jgi:hypothetical protein
MDNEHTILKTFYSKYNKKGGNIASKIFSKLNNRAINSLSKGNFPQVLNNTKTLLRDAVVDITDRGIDEISQNITKEILQGNNPLESFRNNIANRLINSDEFKKVSSIYNDNNINYYQKINKNLSNPIGLSPKIYHDILPLQYTDRNMDPYINKSELY